MHRRLVLLAAVVALAAGKPVKGKMKGHHKGGPDMLDDFECAADGVKPLVCPVPPTPADADDLPPVDMVVCFTGMTTAEATALLADFTAFSAYADKWAAEMTTRCEAAGEPVTFVDTMECAEDAAQPMPFECPLPAVTDADIQEALDEYARGTDAQRAEAVAVGVCLTAKPAADIETLLAGDAATYRAAVDEYTALATPVCEMYGEQWNDGKRGAGSGSVECAVDAEHPVPYECPLPAYDEADIRAEFDEFAAASADERAEWVDELVCITGHSADEVQAIMADFAQLQTVAKAYITAASPMCDTYAEDGPMRRRAGKGKGKGRGARSGSGEDGGSGGEYSGSWSGSMECAEAGGTVVPFECPMPAMPTDLAAEDTPTAEEIACLTGVTTAEAEALLADSAKLAQAAEQYWTEAEAVCADYAEEGEGAEGEGEGEGDDKEAKGKRQQTDV